MPTFDIPGSVRPVGVSVHRDYKPYFFSLPYKTEDPVEIEMLSKHPGVVVIEEKAPAKPVKTEVVEDTKPQKEVKDASID